MKTVLKVLAWFIGGLALLAIGLAIFITLVVDPNEYKPQIASIVEQQVGRKLSIEGDLELTFFPWLGVRTENVALSNPPGFDDESMLTIAQVEIRARLMPLLRKQFEADTIVLRDPSVHLIVDSEGTTNWQDLVKPAEGDATVKEPSDPAAAMAALAVQGIDLKGGKLIWDDRQSGSRFAVENIDLDVGEVLSQKPVDLALVLSFDSDELEQPVDLKLDSQITLALEDGTLTLSQARMESGYGALSAGMETDLTADIENGQVEVGKTAVRFVYGDAGKMTGGFESMNYDLNQASVRTDTLSLSGSYVDQALGQPVTAEVLTRFAADLAGQTIELDDARVSANYGSAASADARFETLRYDLARSSAEINRLDLAGSYSDDRIPQPLSVKMQGDAAVNLVEQLARLIGSQVHLEYGSLGSADIGFDDMLYRFENSTLDVTEADLTGNYAGPEIEQPLALKMKGGVKWDIGRMIAELADMNGTAEYGTVGRTDFAAGFVTYDQGRNLIDAKAVELEGKYEQHDFRGAFSELAADIVGQSLNAPGFDLLVDGVPAKGNLKVSNFLGDAVYSGSVQASDFSPADLIGRLGAEFKTSDPKALRSAALSTNFKGSLNNIRLDELSARLDETQLKGFVEVENFARPAYRFDIDVDGIDVDRYAPVDEGRASEAGAAIVVLPVGLFRGVGANGQLRIGSLRASGVSATDIDIGVESSEEGMTVKPLNAALYGGELEGEMRFTEKDGVARLEIKQSMDRVQVGSLLADTGVTDRISGTGRLDLDVVATEAEGEPRTRGLARFHFFDGAIKGFDLRKIYLQAKRIYNDRKGREEEVETDDREEFRFTEMTGTLEFDEKLASNDDLEVKSPLFRINGRGQADLSANRLDYLLLATVVESTKGQGGEELSELKGVTLPIRISGSLDAPSYTLDVAEILKLALRRRVEKEVEKKVQEKLGDELQEKLGDELQKLLKIN